MEELDAANDGGLLNVGIRIYDTYINGLLNVFCNSIELERTERTQGKAANLLIWTFKVHEERVNSKNCQLLVLLSVVCQV